MQYRYLYVLIILFYSNCAQTQVFRIDTSHNPKIIVEDFLVGNAGVAVKNVKYYGLKNALGLFYYKSTFQFLPPYGLILSSGSVHEALGPNNYTASVENYTKGDKDLSKIAGTKTFDSAILEFDFMSLTDSISFVFQFASEEYPEYVKKGVSDVFGFFVKDYSNNTNDNIGIIAENGTPITIDLINSDHNSDFYIVNNQLEYRYKNELTEDEYYENQNLFQFDGFTKSIHSGKKLEAYKKYHFKIAIADAGDRKFDSWIFIHGNSFASTGKLADIKLEDLKEYFEFFNLDSIELAKSNDKLTLLVPVYFDFNSYKIKDSSKEYLNYLCNLLTFSGYSVTINGYADETGTKEYNLELSQKRADQVKNYFANNGINQNRISSFGKGEIRLGKNSRSRKVEFILYKKSSSKGAF